MPIPKWCDPKSIRTVKRGKASILICCPVKKWKRGKCSVGTKAIDARRFGAITSRVRPMPGTGKGSHTFVAQATRGDYTIYKTWTGAWRIKFRVHATGEARNLPEEFQTKATAVRAMRDHDKFLSTHFRGFGEAWLSDPRLPDSDQAGDRVHGDKRPKQHPPHRAMIIARKVVKRPGMAPVKLQVETNRTKTRFWFQALLGEKPAQNDPMAHLPSHHPDEHVLIYSYMLDYDSTTSQKKAQGWIAAIQGK
jgi:hypothetical protein